MSPPSRRLINFAGSTLALEYDGSQAAAIVDFLYRHVSGESAVRPQVTYRVMSGGEPGRLALYRDDKLVYEGDSGATLAELLLGDSCHHLAKQSRGGLLFHAAAVAWQGKGVLLPGGIGAGKTTLTAWLVTKGLHYLTDEMVFIPHGADEMQPLARPLNLKLSAAAVLETAIDFAGQAGHILRSSHSYLISPASLGTTTAPGKLPLGLMIFPHYLPHGEFKLRALSKAETGLALMQCLVNARNLSGHGFSEVARLAKMARAYRLTYAVFDQIGGQLEALLPPA